MNWLESVLPLVGVLVGLGIRWATRPSLPLPFPGIHNTAPPAPAEISER